jgi:hypothetical protein
MFRVVVIVAIAMGLVIALAAIISPLAGAILLAVEAAYAIALVVRGSRGSEHQQHEVAQTADDGVHRVLVVANETVGGAALLSEIQSRTGDRKSEILVITPALAGSRLEHWSSDIDEGLATARERLERSVKTLSSLGLDVRGEVGDHDPNSAISDALRAYAADEVIIATHTPERSRWLEQGVVERAREEVPIPVTHVIVDLEGEKATS